jgi:hypothetical protein
MLTGRRSSSQGLRDDWAEVRRALAEEDEVGSSIIEYLDLGSGVPGRTRVSLAKEALCTKVNVNRNKFETTSSLPLFPPPSSAVSAREFCCSASPPLDSESIVPSTSPAYHTVLTSILRRNRHKVPNSAAEQIVGLIARADPNGFIKRMFGAGCVVIPKPSCRRPEGLRGRV